MVRKTGGASLSIVVDPNDENRVKLFISFDSVAGMLEPVSGSEIVTSPSKQSFLLGDDLPPCSPTYSEASNHTAEVEEGDLPVQLHLPEQATWNDKIIQDVLKSLVEEVDKPPPQYSEEEALASYLSMLILKHGRVHPKAVTGSDKEKIRKKKRRKGRMDVNNNNEKDKDKDNVGEASAQIQQILESNTTSELLMEELDGPLPPPPTDVSADESEADTEEKHRSNDSNAPILSEPELVEANVTLLEVAASYHELLLAGERETDRRGGFSSSSPNSPPSSSNSEGIFTPVAWEFVPSRSAEAAEAVLQEAKDREKSRELLESRLVHEEQLNKDLQGLLDASKKEESRLSKLLWEAEAKAKANDQHYELSLTQSELARGRQEQNDKARIMELMVKLASAEQVVENGTSLPESATSSNDEVSKLQARIVELECQIEVSRAQSKEMEERCQARIVEEKEHAFISIRSAHESNLRSLAQVRDEHAMQLLVEEEKRLRLEKEVNSQAAKAREEYKLLEGVNSSNQNEISALLAKIDVLELERGLLEQRVAMVTAKADNSQSRCDELEKRVEKLLKSGDFGGEADVWREKAVACEIQLFCQVEKHGKWKRRAHQLRKELDLLQEQWRESQVSMIQLQTKGEVQKVLQLRESDRIQQIEQTREQEKVQWQNEKEFWVQRADELERQVAALTGEREEMTRKHSAVEDRLHRIREVYGTDVESALDEFVKKLSYQEKTINLLRRELSQAHQTTTQSRAEAEAKSQSYQEVSRQLSLLQQSRSKRLELAPIVGVASPPSTGETYRRTNIYRSALEAASTSASASGKSNSQCENENDRAVSMTPTAPAVDRSPHLHASPRTQRSSLYGQEVVRVDSTVVKK
jgi:hypothetical protein